MSEQRPKTEIPAKIDALKADLDKVAAAKAMSGKALSKAARDLGRDLRPKKEPKD